MTFILDRKLNKGVPLPFFIACEGYSDACLINALLKHNGINNCSVGCPSRDSVGGEGKDKLPSYLSAAQAALALKSQTLSGILVVVDADMSSADSYTAANVALEEGEFPLAPRPFEIFDLAIRVAVYVIPGAGRQGTMEHLLLDAAYLKRPRMAKYVDKFLTRINRHSIFHKPVYGLNRHAKMKMSALAAATCEKNPWASASMIWSNVGNPVPVDSPCFSHLVDFLKRFSTP